MATLSQVPPLNGATDHLRHIVPKNVHMDNPRPNVKGFFDWYSGLGGDRSGQTDPVTQPMV